jgi:ADP-heptose:LPS heptosyltransferase
VGWGDEIIAAGQARVLYKQAREPVVIRDRNGNMRSHAIWEGNPYIATRSTRITSKSPELRNGPGVRPYIARKFEDRWEWRNFDCPRGDIFLTRDEIAFADPFAGEVIIEPHTKQKASPNKQWGRERWTRLVELLRDAGIKPFQMGDDGTQLIPGARLIRTPHFRYACAVLAVARGAILPEGGLHHAAAALDTPAVVIFGGYISPAQTGYAGQANIFTGGKPCGSRLPCAHCAKAMTEITPERVLERFMAVMGRRDVAV